MCSISDEGEALKCLRRNAKEKHTISLLIQLCMHESCPEVFINGATTFHTSGEAEVLSGQQKAYKASKDHGPQHILATNQMRTLSIFSPKNHSLAELQNASLHMRRVESHTGNGDSPAQGYSKVYMWFTTQKFPKFKSKDFQNIKAHIFPSAMN